MIDAKMQKLYGEGKFLNIEFLNIYIVDLISVHGNRSLFLHQITTNRMIFATQGLRETAHIQPPLYSYSRVFLDKVKLFTGCLFQQTFTQL